MAEIAFPRASRFCSKSPDSLACCSLLFSDGSCLCHCFLCCRPISFVPFDILFCLCFLALCHHFGLHVLQHHHHFADWVCTLTVLHVDCLGVRHRSKARNQNHPCSQQCCPVR